MAVKAYPNYWEMAQAINHLVNAYNRSTFTNRMMRPWTQATISDMLIVHPPQLSEIQEKGVSGYLDLVGFLAEPQAFCRAGWRPPLSDQMHPS